MAVNIADTSGQEFGLNVRFEQVDHLPEVLTEGTIYFVTIDDDYARLYVTGIGNNPAVRQVLGIRREDDLANEGRNIDDGGSHTPPRLGDRGPKVLD